MPARGGDFVSAAKNKETSAPAKSRQVAEFLGWLFLGPPRGITWSVVALVGFVGLSYGLWQHVGPQVLSGPEYTIGPRDVEITPPPSWIRSDLAGDVVRGLSLDAPLSILDDDIAQRLHEAFAAQPWVAKVERVSKQHPARVRVDLVYRRPVCMVETSGAPLPGSTVQIPPRLLPIDVQGVLLPERDFTDDKRRQYPRLAGIPTSPPSVAGGRWTDSRVIGGAQIAAELIDVWTELSLERIVASSLPDTSLEPPEHTYEIFTTGGTRILWGHAPDTRMPGVVSVFEKIARLKQIKKDEGSLEGPAGPRTIDVHYWRHVRITPGTRTATRPETSDGVKR
jgi:hypothetical protein